MAEDSVSLEASKPGKVSLATWRGMSQDAIRRHLRNFHAGWHDPIQQILDAAENIVVTGGVNGFSPFQGFRDISTNRTLFSLFANVRFRF
jgi:hypothetical protein